MWISIPPAVKGGPGTGLSGQMGLYMTKSGNLPGVSVFRVLMEAQTTVIDQFNSRVSLL